MSVKSMVNGFDPNGPWQYRPYLDTSGGLDPTYSDDFTASALDTTKWTRVNYVVGNETLEGGSWLRQTGTASGYYYFTAPSGSFAFNMGWVQLDPAANGFYGIGFFDNTGKGSALTTCNNPNECILLDCAAGVYIGAGAFTGLAQSPTATFQGAGLKMWFSLAYNSSTSVLTAKVSMNGGAYGASVTRTINGSIVPTRICIGNFSAGGGAGFLVDVINRTA